VVRRTVADPSGKRAHYQRFFQQVVDDLREKHGFVSTRVASPRNWLSFSSGTNGFTYAVAFTTGGRFRVEIYIDMRDRERYVAAFEKLRASESALIRELGEPLKWEPLEGKRACRIAVYRTGAIDDSADSLEEYCRWAVDRFLQLRNVLGSRIPAAAECGRTLPSQRRESKAFLRPRPSGPNAS
jgi:hypothetical protein